MTVEENLLMGGYIKEKTMSHIKKLKEYLKNMKDLEIDEINQLKFYLVEREGTRESLEPLL
jgi:ABC-type branched-subunit amino acid transport system ATPase component